MQNFQPLVRNLHAENAALLAHNEAELVTAITRALGPEFSRSTCANASRVLATHHGATELHLKVLHPLGKTA
jgi:3-deoxy-D-manno-octulosonic-acid transferase